MSIRFNSGASLQTLKSVFKEDNSINGMYLLHALCQNEKVIQFSFEEAGIWGIVYVQKHENNDCMLYNAFINTNLHCDNKKVLLLIFLSCFFPILCSIVLLLLLISKWFLIGMMLSDFEETIFKAHTKLYRKITTKFSN